MANGIVTPPDYRAANAITGFTEGLKSGVGIVRDVQGIKQNKIDSERKKVTDAQADEDRTQNKKDTHVQRVPDYLRSTVAAAYAGKDTEAADILNMVFLPDPKSGVPPVKAKRVTKIQAEDGSPSIEIEYEGGKIVQVDAKVARGWANGMRNETPNMGGSDRETIRASEYAVNSAREDLKDWTDNHSEDVAGIKERKAALADAEEQYSAATGVKIGRGKGGGVSEQPKRAAPGTLPKAVPGSMTEQERARKGYGVSGAAPEPAPVATTGPGAAAAGGKVAMTNPSNGKTFMIKPESVEKYKAMGYTLEGQ